MCCASLYMKRGVTASASDENSSSRRRHRRPHDVYFVFRHIRVAFFCSAHAITIIIIILELYMALERHRRLCVFAPIHISRQCKKKTAAKGRNKNECCATGKKKPNYVYFALCETSKWKEKSEMKNVLIACVCCECARARSRSLIHIHIIIIIFNIST